MTPAAGLLAMVAVGYLILFSLSALGAAHAARPEVVRKLAHISTSLLALTFPSVLREDWAVFAFCGLTLAHLWAIRTYPPAKRRFGVILGGLEKSSWGDLCLPVSIAAMFYLSAGDRVLFYAPILVLALADPVAALVGKRYGTVRYRTPEGTKSLEGSAAFFLVAFLCAHVALLLASATGRAQSLLLSLVLALAATLVESAAWRGLDNVSIPLAIWLLLRALKDTSLWAR